MESNRFDILARRLSTTDSRRGAIKSLAVGLGLGMLRLDDTEAKKRKKRKKANPCRGLRQACTLDRDCCGGRTCAHIALCDAPVFSCCNKPGTACSGPCDCCNFGNCVEGKCCSPIGMPCERDADCCGDTTYCDTEGFFHCCKQLPDD